MRTWSPLRYPGGKGQMYKIVLNIIEKNTLLGCKYIEPFAGGAGVAIRLLLENKVESIYLNDYDRSIYAFWYSILYETDRFIGKLKDTIIDMESYYVQKEIQKRKDDAKLFDLGFSTFFLNRTNRSGIITSGPIGGHDQSGDYKMDCRFNKESLIDLIERIALRKNEIMIYNLDAKDFIREIKEDFTFYFIDPPYYKNGEQLYVNFFNHRDHEQLAAVIKEQLLNNNFLISYDFCSEIKNIYDYLESFTMELYYSLQIKRKANEIWFKSPRIIL